MAFYLVRSLNNVSCYGRVPDPFSGPEGAFQEFSISSSDSLLLDGDFCDPINELCGTLLDYGDIDYFDAEQCKMLVSWINQRLRWECERPLLRLYAVLLEYAEQAIALGTGVVVEL